jgi:hypothetical protein
MFEKDVGGVIKEGMSRLGEIEEVKKDNLTSLGKRLFFFALRCFLAVLLLFLKLVVLCSSGAGDGAGGVVVE